MDQTTGIQDQLPLTETTLFLLLSLVSGPRHGYAIYKDVQTLSGGRVILSTGTLYGAIKRLVEQGWIERFPGQTPGENDRPRKEYRLTEQGRRIFEAESARLQNLVVAVRLRSAGDQA